MNILSIQSHVAYGHVGNAAATFPLQRLGIEVWPVHTVQFSNHTGYGAWRGRVFEGAFIREVVQGIEERGVLGQCDGVLSGYMGEAAIGEAILEAVSRVKRANPAARYCCDPVIGDVDRGVYVRPGIAEFMRERAVPAADIVTPNQFELEHISGRSAQNRDGLIAAVEALHALGPEVVVVTSVHADDTPDDALDLIVSARNNRWRVRTPRLPIAINGAGDVIAALFLAHYLRTGSACDALARATASVFSVLQKTAEAGSREILLVAAQNELVAPTQEFPVEKL